MKHSQSGAGVAAVLVVLLVLAALYLGYFGMPQMGAEKRKGATAIDAGRSVACQTQRQQIERDIEMWKADHTDEQPSLSALRASGIRVPSCPEGGTYDLAGSSVRCSLHR